MTKSLGEIAYETYADQTGLIAAWADVPFLERSAWMLVGAAVADDLLNRLFPQEVTAASPVEVPACPVVENPASIGRPDAVPVVQLPPGAADLIRINCKACGHPASSHLELALGNVGCLVDVGDFWCACKFSREQVRSGVTA